MWIYRVMDKMKDFDIMNTIKTRKLEYVEHIKRNNQIPPFKVRSPMENLMAEEENVMAQKVLQNYLKQP